MQATAVQGAASDTVQAWKDKANTILRTLESALGDYAAKNKLPAHWPDSFFVPPRAPGRKQPPPVG